MAENTEISWTDHTGNLWWGCTEVHAGCDNCYARTLAHRWGFEVWGQPGSKGGVRRLVKSFWKDLNKFQKKAEEAGKISTVFVGSMMDIFEKPLPLVDNAGEPIMIQVFEHSIAQNTGNVRSVFFDRIDAGQYPNLLFLLLTKRPSNINKYIPALWREEGAPDNVMFGYSVVDNASKKEIEELLQVNGRLFLSMEPLLEQVDVRPYITTTYVRCMDICPDTLCDGSVDIVTSTAGRETWPYCPHCGHIASYVQTDEPKIEWVIVGGESGPKARPMHPDWVRSLRDQCSAAGVKFHFKQYGEHYPLDMSHSIVINGKNGWDFKSTEADHEIVGNTITKGQYKRIGDAAWANVGKKAAGRLLDGREHDDMPV